MLRVVEQEALAHGLARAERHQPDWPAVHLLLDRDGAAHDQCEKRAWRALLEQHLVGFVPDEGHQTRELVVRRIGEAVEEGNCAQLIANGRGRHGREANAAVRSFANQLAATTHQLKRRASQRTGRQSANRSVCLSTFGGGDETVSVSSSGVPNGIPTRAHNDWKNRRNPSR